MTPASGGDSGRNARYAFLVARLRNRQMTMEEATELFNLMQGMLQTSESARAALVRAAAPAAPAVRPMKPESPRPAPSGSSDDFLLLGILAMGAGAGLLAAMTKRLQDATPPSGTGSGGAASSTSPKG